MSRAFRIPRIATSDLTIGGKDFVVVSKSDFARLQEALEDAADLAFLRDARKVDAGKSGISTDEARAQLGLSRKPVRPRIAAKKKLA
jgi:hypothetical protein